MATAPPLEQPRSSLCVFKQYVGDIRKPLHLHGAETLQITLSGSLAFVVALAWNDFFRHEFTSLLQLWKLNEDRLKLVYAMMATLVLFGFNLTVGAAVTSMRNRAQRIASEKAKQQKLKDTTTKRLHRIDH